MRENIHFDLWFEVASYEGLSKVSPHLPSLYAKLHELYAEPHRGNQNNNHFIYQNISI